MKLAAFFQNVKKTVHALRVNETKATSRNAFIDNLSELECKKQFINNEKSLF